MPIFEYLCRRCNRIYSFLSLASAPAREPVCPRCGATGLKRVPSSFAVSAPSKSRRPPDAGGDEPGDAADPRTEGELMRMLEGLDERDADNPRTMARVMRRLAEASGEPMTPTMQEMFRRLEAGEDPDALEEELGAQLEAEMGEEGGEEPGSSAPTRDGGLYSL